MLRGVASRYLISAGSALLAGCELDERALHSPPIDWIEIDAGGQVDIGAAGSESPRAGSGPLGSGGRAGAAGSSGGGFAAVAGASGASAGAGIGGGAGVGGGRPGPGCGTACQTLVTNGTFDNDVASWSADPKVEQSWSTLDANDQSASGSLVIASTGKEDRDGYDLAGTEQCIDVAAASDYHFAAQVWLDPEQSEGSGGVMLEFFGERGCEGATLDTRAQVVTAVDAWLPAATDPPTPAGARSVALRLIVARPYRSATFSASFDDVVLLER